MYTITTTYKNVNGTPKVIAKCDGRQKTTNLDLSKSLDWTHGAAAGALALVLELPWHDGIEHDVNDNGASLVHRFAWTPSVLIDLARQSIV